MSRFPLRSVTGTVVRGLLPGVLMVVVLPLTLALIAIAIGATTLHQNEMRDLIALRDERAVREAANSLAERMGHHVQTLHAAAELVSLGVPLAEVPQRLGESAGRLELMSDSSSTLTSLVPVTTTSDGRVLIVGQSSDGQSVVRGTFTPQALGLPAFADDLRGSSDLHVTLLDHGARTIFHGDTAHMNFDPAAVFAQQPGVDGSLRGESGSVFLTDPDRVEWVVAYAPVPQTGWGLIVAEPWAHVANPSLSTSLLTPLVLIPAVLIAVIVVIFGARRVIRPLQQLEVQAARAGQGDYAALAQPISGISEIQTLQLTLVQMADQLRRYQRSLQSYAADVISGQEDERTRLARELHDETVQSLIALDQRLQLIERTARRDPAAVLAKLSELRVLTAGTIEEVRRVIHDLRPIYLEDLGLAAAIEMLTQSVAQADRLAASCTIAGETWRLAPEHELAVYRIVQEALNNVVKHAQAKHVQVQLRFGADLSISIRDDGVGFAMPDRVDALTDRGHFGLIGMRERAELIGARLTIHSSPGQGATVELILPAPLS
jgi:two-component system sensor histidine kinase UhpB